MMVLVLLFGLLIGMGYCVCGDGVLDDGEECDDGNTRDFDGCSSICEIERSPALDKPMYSCSGEPSVCVYVSPMGLPKPPIFCTEFTRWQYEGEAGYSDAGNGPYTYYVDNSVTCSDSSTIADRVNFDDLSNPGSPSNPRCTLPKNGLVAGDVVEVHAGSYDYSNYGGNKFGVFGTGTPTQPIIISGGGSALFHYREFHVSGEYLIIEHVRQGPNGAMILLANHTCLRHSELFGDDTPSDGASSSTRASQNTFFHNVIRNRGMWWDTTQENDWMGVAMSSSTEDVWVLDNDIHEVGGDSVGTCHACGYTTSYWYIGRNLMYRNGENAVDLKEVHDVIVSENVGTLMEGWSAGSGGSGTVYVAHYGPSNPPYDIWFLGNYALDSTGTGFITTGGVNRVYFLGNVAINVQHGFRSWSSHDQWIVGNTVYDSEIGVDFSGGASDTVTIQNNIFSELRSDVYVQLDDSQYRAAAVVNKNLYWRSSDSGAGIQTDGTCSDCNVTDPLFLDVSGVGRNLHLSENSPARGAALAASPYDTFYSKYVDRFTRMGSPEAADIKKDLDGVPFPETVPHAIGAYQWIVPPPPIPPEGPNIAGIVTGAVLGTLSLVGLVVAILVVVLVVFFVCRKKEDILEKSDGGKKMEMDSSSSSDES